MGGRLVDQDIHVFHSAGSLGRMGRVDIAQMHWSPRSYGFGFQEAWEKCLGERNGVLFLHTLEQHGLLMEVWKIIFLSKWVICRIQFDEHIFQMG